MSFALVRAISAAETRPLRRAVLRPHQREEELVYAGDDDASSGHFGAFLDEKLVGVASVYELPGGAARLRGMATLPEVRGQGIGGALLAAALAHAVRVGATHMWCHARAPARRFYERHGFVAQGEPFEIEHIGPHLYMVKPLVVVHSR